MIIILIILGCVGCGYHLVGSNPALPDQAKSIGIFPIQNQTFQGGLDTSLMTQMKEKLRDNASVRLVAPTQADLALRIALTTINEKQVIRGEASEFHLDLIGRVTLEDQRNQKKIWEKNIQANSLVYYETGDENASVTVSTRNQGLVHVTASFAEKIYEQIFSKF